MIETTILNRRCTRLISPSKTTFHKYNPFTFEIVVHKNDRSGSFNAALAITDILCMARDHGILVDWWEVSLSEFVVYYPQQSVLDWIRSIAFARNLAITIYRPYYGEYSLKWDGKWSR